MKQENGCHRTQHHDYSFEAAVLRVESRGVRRSDSPLSLITGHLLKIRYQLPITYYIFLILHTSYFIPNYRDARYTSQTPKMMPAMSGNQAPSQGGMVALWPRAVLTVMTL